MNADNAAGRDHQSTRVTKQQQATTGALGYGRRVVFAIVLATFLGACGGGGDPGSPATTIVEAPLVVSSADAARSSIVAVFGGTLSDDNGYDLLYVVMRDGTKIGYFGTDWSNSFKFVGSWTSTDSEQSWLGPDGTQFFTSNGYYRGEPALVSTTFDMATPRMSGLIKVGPYPTNSFTTRTVAISGGSISGSSYTFRSPGSVAAVEGAWKLVDPRGNTVAIDIASDGGLKGSYRGCSFTGSAMPSDEGQNALTLSFNFDQPRTTCSPDVPVGRSFKGFAIALPMTGQGTRLLIYVVFASAFDDIELAAVGQR